VWCRQSLDDHCLVAVTDSQLYVLVQCCIQIFHERLRQCPQRFRQRRKGSQLPQPHADRETAVRFARKCAGVHQFHGKPPHCGMRYAGQLR
jgi:hypothetical protein